MPLWNPYNCCTCWFRSCELQQEYDRLKAELQKAEDDAQQNMNKRRGIAQEKREAKLERDEAEKYQHMKDELVRDPLEAVSDTA